MTSYSGTHYSDVNPRIGIYAVAKMLAYANSQLVLEKFAMVTPLPANKGLTIKWRRCVPFPVDTSTTLEGQTVNPEIMEYEDVSATISQYSGWVQITDVISQMHEDPVLDNIVSLISKKAADTKEAIIWGVLKAGTNVIYSGAATTRATVEAPISGDELDLAIRTLKANHAEPLTSMLSGSDDFGSEAIRGGYIAVGHVNLQQDLERLDGYVPIHKYGSQSPLCPQEEGARGQIRFILTPHLEPFFGAGSSTTTGVLNTNSAVDVYPLVVFGKDAYGVTPLKGMNSAKIRVKNPGDNIDETDPNGQRGFVSWIMWYVAVRLNELWMIRLECAVSAL